jgi:recombination associated protein RdgC
MPFFRNLTLLRFSPAVAKDLKRLDETLDDHRLRPCGPLELGTKGFVPPLGSEADTALTHSEKHFTCVTVGREDKILPAAVVNEELSRRVHKIAAKEGRKVGGRERKRIKEDVLTELLPRAFVRGSRLSAYVDTKNGWLVLDTSSRKSAENAITQIREALGSFPAIPLAPEEGPRVLMTDWLANGTLPAGLAFGDECELRDPATAAGARWKGRSEDLESEEVKEHLRNGKQVFHLGLVFDDRLSFVLGEDLVVRKLKFLDTAMDALGNNFEDAKSEADAALTLLTLELERLLAKLQEWFVLPRPADE